MDTHSATRIHRVKRRIIGSRMRAAVDELRAVENQMVERANAEYRDGWPGADQMEELANVVQEINMRLAKVLIAFEKL